MATVMMMMATESIQQNKQATATQSDLIHNN